MESEDGLKLGRIAEVTGGRLAGPPTEVHFRRIRPLEQAGPGDLALLSSRRYLVELASSSAGALLVSEALESDAPKGTPRVVVQDANTALTALLPVLYPAEAAPPAIHPTAELGRGVQIGEGVAIGPFTVVGAGASIGPGTRLHAQVAVGDGCSVGAGCVLHPQVVLYPGTTLGDRVILHAGARIGVDGFGYASGPGGHTKVPQVGGCRIEDDVEIGAGTCVDRGSIGDTVIGAGTKIDNLVHIGHNVHIGPGSILVAQVGIAGSTRAGAGVLFGGQAGLIGHLRIGAGAKIGAQAGVIGDVAAGEEVIGFPARPRKEFLRGVAQTMKLGDVLRRLRAIEQLVGEGGGQGEGASPRGSDPE